VRRGLATVIRGLIFVATVSFSGEIRRDVSAKSPGGAWLFLVGTEVALEGVRALTIR